MKLFSLQLKKVTFVLFVFIFGSALFVNYSVNKRSDTNDFCLSLKQIREDFSELTEKIESGVPNAFYYCSKSDYHLIKNSVYNQLEDNMTVQEFFRVLYPLVQFLNDAHFSIHLPDNITEDKNVSYFPVKVIISENRLYTQEDLSSVKQIEKGEEILSINKKSSQEIISKIRGGVNYKNKNDQIFFEYRNEVVFHRRLYSLFEFTGTFEIETTNKTYFLEGVGSEKFDILPKEEYEFKMLNSETGYLKINRLTIQQDSLKNFIERDFSLLKKKSVNNLILDIRGNLGGSSVLAKNVLDYFTDSPYTLSVGVDYFYKGKRYSSDTDQIHIPLISENKFKGKIILLSDVLTYSSAHMMQVGFKYYNMGITLGQESSESLYITGEIKQTILKNSKIELIAPTVNFKLPGYSENKEEYYVPDYTIYPSLSDRLDGNDLFLYKALNILK